MFNLGRKAFLEKNAEKRVVEAIGKAESKTLAEIRVHLGHKVKKDVYTEEDGWTVRTKDGKPSVHFEHDVCIRKGKADILSDYSGIEKAEKGNSNLFTHQILQPLA